MAGAAAGVDAGASGAGAGAAAGGAAGAAIVEGAATGVGLGWCETKKSVNIDTYEEWTHLRDHEHQEILLLDLT